MSSFREKIGKLSGVVIIMGACGSGKSSLGRFISSQCEPNSIFIEGDDHHPPGNITKMSQGKITVAMINIGSFSKKVDNIFGVTKFYRIFHGF